MYVVYWMPARCCRVYGSTLANWVGWSSCNLISAFRQSGNRLPDYQIIRLPDSRFLHVPVIDDADDAGVDRRFGGIERKACFLAAHEEHMLADARTDRIHGDQRPPHRLAIGRERLHDEQRDPRQVAVLSRRDDVADYLSNLHRVIRESGNRVIAKWGNQVTQLPNY